ncbi:prephenate dehydratase domain-containing protein [Ihubacter sp. rT4E-8]|uniref:prephenate dehydratase domain-containing protein n=1 Tax=Ihubacter sp. rT4E-8 TaxID=3242369 RepID=UPI003CF5B973
MKNIVIGYQGIENSNNHRAARMLAVELNFDTLTLRPLLSSVNVVKALQNKEIDYGVMAFSTDVAGEVMETKNATKDVGLDILDSVSFDIHHCLFVKDADVKEEEIKIIASHPEALRECEKNVRMLFPGAEHMQVQDTAFAARSLSMGELSRDTAVLCSMNAGLENNLILLKADVEDLEHNGTTFSLVKIK